MVCFGFLHEYCFQPIMLSVFAFATEVSLLNKANRSVKTLENLLMSIANLLINKQRCHKNCHNILFYYVSNNLEILSSNHEISYCIQSILSSIAFSCEFLTFYVNACLLSFELLFSFICCVSHSNIVFFFIVSSLIAF